MKLESIYIEVGLTSYRSGADIITERGFYSIGEGIQ